MPQLPDTQYTAFRLAEKHFKDRSIPGRLPSLHGQNLIDLSRPDQLEDDEVWKAGWWGSTPGDEHEARWRKWRKGKERARGERSETCTRDIKGIQLNSGTEAWVVAEGCILIPRYLDHGAQLDLLAKAMSEYTLPPNPLSLSTHYDLPPNLFELYASTSSRLIQPLHATSSGQRDGVGQQATARETIETEPGSVLGYEEILARNKTWAGDAYSEKLEEKTAEQLFNELRWANLGWIYQWSTKSYDFSSEEPIQFPQPLAKTLSRIVQDVPWDEVFSELGSDGPDWAIWGNNYVPDTGIVNFYRLKDTLMGHVDRAELDPSRPLVSISLGHAAVFLLGTSSRNDPPIPIILRSGDVLVMSGKGRQSYHGVPRIMEDTLPAHFAPEEGDSAVLAASKRWLQSGRININARQVFPPGFQRAHASAS